MMINGLSGLKIAFQVICGRGECLPWKKYRANYANRHDSSFNLLYQSSFPHSC